MDSILAKRLKDLSRQNEKLKEAELMFRQLEASKDSLWGQLFLKQEGGSIAEREAKASASKEWSDFMAGLAVAESKFNYERRRYDVLGNVYIGELNSFKNDVKVIKKQI